jgi:acyl dehydratase
MTSALPASLQPFMGEAAEPPVTMLDPIDRSAIRRWCEAIGDRNPIYLDPAHPATRALGGILAPPAMLDAWTTSRYDPDAKTGGDGIAVLSALAQLGFPVAVASGIQQHYDRYLRPGDVITQRRYVESISPEKKTALGDGRFVVLRSEFTDQQSAPVGRMHMTILKFRPSGGTPMASPGTAPVVATGDGLPQLTVPLTTTRIVASAIATGDFEPIHHDRSAAQRAGRSDVFMNILSINGFMQRCVTDWAGPTARIRSVKLILGGPSVAGDVLTIRGKLIDVPPPSRSNGPLEIELTANTSLGLSASARIVMTLAEHSASPK